MQSESKQRIWSMLDRTGKQKIWRLQPGQIVRIELGNGVHSYGPVLKEPLVAFYDKPYEVQETSLDKISALPVAFALMVMTDAVTRGRWPIIGDVAIPPRLEVPPRFCKQDALTGDLSIYQEVPELAPITNVRRRLMNVGGWKRPQSGSPNTWRIASATILPAIPTSGLNNCDQS